MRARASLRAVEGGARGPRPDARRPGLASGEGMLARLAVRADRRDVEESHRVLADIARNAIAARPLRRRLRAALRTDDGLGPVVEWLRVLGYGVSREGLLAAWVARRPAAPEVAGVAAGRERHIGAQHLMDA